MLRANRTPPFFKAGSMSEVKMQKYILAFLLLLFVGTVNAIDVFGAGEVQIGIENESGGGWEWYNVSTYPIDCTILIVNNTTIRFDGCGEGTYVYIDEVMTYENVTTFTLPPITTDKILLLTFYQNITSPLTGASFGTGTSSVALTVTTSTNATCRYYPLSVSYPLMTTFDSTGSKDHNHTITGIGSGSHYAYVKCRDITNRETSGQVSFRIQSASPGGSGGGAGTRYIPKTECGNGICETGENQYNCPQDCGNITFSASPLLISHLSIPQGHLDEAFNILNPNPTPMTFTIEVSCVGEDPLCEWITLNQTEITVLVGNEERPATEVVRFLVDVPIEMTGRHEADIIVSRGEQKIAVKYLLDVLPPGLSHIWWGLFGWEFKIGKLGSFKFWYVVILIMAILMFRVVWGLDREREKR